MLLGEEFFRLENLGPLQMANLCCEPLDRRCNNAESGEIHCVAIARNNLGRNWLYREPHGLGDMGFNARIDLRECPYGA